MNKENIPVITDREELYDKCENMEQLFDKYYLPLLDKHYSKIYELQQENQQLKERYENLMCGYKFLNNRVKQGMSNENKNKCLIELGNQILREIEKSDSNE